MYKHARSVWVVCMYMSKCVCVGNPESKGKSRGAVDA